MKELSPSTQNLDYTKEEIERLNEADRILELCYNKINSAKIDAQQGHAAPYEYHKQSIMALVEKITALTIDEYQDDVSKIKTDDMHLSVGLSNALIRAGIYKVGDLIPYSYQELLEKPKIGKAYITELKRKLGEFGITLPDKK